MEQFDQEHLKNSEAVEWVRRYKKKVNDLGWFDARKWWQENIQAIEKIRGKEAAQDLQRRMNEYRK